MPGFESEIDTERSKVIVRWVAIAILAWLLTWERGHHLAPMSTPVLLAIVGGVSLANLVHTVYLFSAMTCPPAYKYITVGLDLAFLSATIAFTGYNQSPFFYVYFVVLISNCLRYGLVMSLYIAVLVNLFYAVALSLSPEPLPTTVLGGEGLKLLAFWAVAFYGGAVSARIRRQGFELASYIEQIAELRAELRARDAPETAQESAADA